MVYSSISELTGHTPLVALTNYARATGLSACILGKFEYFNHAGSSKDRVALAIIEEAERSGKLKRGGVIVEPTSGNTGVGLASVAAARGYRVVLTMPDTMSRERRQLLAAYGAELVLTEGAKGMAGAIQKAEEIANATPGALLAGQFVNPANPRAHYERTGPELWADAEGDLAAFVAGVGTGGTLSGVGKYLKERDGRVRIVAVEPKGSPVLSAGKSGKHGLQGIGAGFVPDTLDMSLIDEVLTVTEEEAITACRLLATSEGVLVGISSGAALHAAGLLAKRAEYEKKRIAVLFPDGGERYLSTGLFA